MVHNNGHSPERASDIFKKLENREIAGIDSIPEYCAIATLDSLRYAWSAEDDMENMWIKRISLINHVSSPLTSV